MWFKWHLTNFKWKFRGLFSKMKKDADKEVEGIGVTPIGMELEIGENYKEFWNNSINLSTFSTMNYAAILMFLSVIIIIWRMFISPPGPMSKDYLLWSAIGLFVLMLVVLIIASVIQSKKSKNYYTPEDIRLANEWLKLVGEKDRESMPWWAWAILLVGLTVESIAVAIIAAPYVADISEKYTIVAGAAVGIIMAVVLGIVVHKAGESLYKALKQNSLVERMIDEVKQHHSLSDSELRQPLSDYDRCLDSKLFT